MSANQITKDSHPELWERLEKLWIESRRAGTVILRGAMYKVLLPDDTPVFVPASSTLDDNYSSISTGSLSK